MLRGRVCVLLVCAVLSALASPVALDGTVLLSQHHHNHSAFPIRGLTNLTASCVDMSQQAAELMGSSAECRSLLVRMKSGAVSGACESPCWGNYMVAYSFMASHACLGSAPSPQSLVATACGGNSSTCQDISGWMMSAMGPDDCVSFLSALTHGTDLSSHCSTPCFTTYMHTYTALSQAQCLSPSDPSPPQLRRLACDPALPAPPSVIPVHPLPMPEHTRDANCDAVAMQTMSPLRYTVCKGVVGDEQGVVDVAEMCDATCWEDVMQGYTNLYAMGCLENPTEFPAPDQYSYDICQSNKTWSGQSITTAPMQSTVYTTIAMPLSGSPDHIIAVSSTALTLALAQAVAVPSAKVSIATVTQDGGSSLVTFAVTASADGGSVLASRLVDAVMSGVLASNVNHRLGVDNITTAIMSGPDYDVGPACDALKWRDECGVAGEDWCDATPSEGCCAAVFVAITSGCEDQQGVCDDSSLAVYFDSHCAKRAAPRPSKPEGDTASIGHTTITQGQDVNGCLSNFNYTWCPSKNMCVQNYVGGDQGPCPPVETVGDCENGCSSHGQCMEDDSCQCFPGYAGSDCSVECPGECSSHGLCLESGECECGPNWHGEMCEYPIGQNVPGSITFDCPGTPHMCSGAGLCIDHECQCNFGYSGNDCSHHEFASCPAQCHDHGVACVNKTCVCHPGYKGVTCMNVVGCADANFCSGRGTCNDDTLSCDCLDGFVGADCMQQEQCVSSCSGHGICSGHPDFTCNCDDWFTGTGCDTLSGSPCPHSCSGLGRCNHTSGHCRCARGFSGVDCTTVSLPSVCVRCKHGQCMYGDVGTPASCKCDEGWAGEHCDQITACSEFSFCSGRGTCVDNVCECFSGFDGPDCSQTDLCGPSFCSGHGTCEVNYAYDPAIEQMVLTGVCQCRSTWTGPDCESSLCPSTDGVCSAHGICELVSGVPQCVCDQGYVGADCSEALQSCPGEPECSNQGVCTDGVCVCNDGFDGDDCSAGNKATTTSTCCPFSCSDNGQCVQCQCQCNADWTGEACDEFVAGSDD